MHVKNRYYLFPKKVGLYPIINSITWLIRMFNIGIKTVQLRIKNNNYKKIKEIVYYAIQLGKQYNARLFINHHWDLAINFGAYGVHLGQNDIKYADLNAIHNARLCLGVSAYNEIEIEQALNCFPSYIALGNVFHTNTKIMCNNVPQGLITLKYLSNKIKTIPVIAIGGIKINHIEAILDCNIDGIAVISAITQAPDWFSTTIAMQNKISTCMNIKKDTLHI